MVAHDLDKAPGVVDLFLSVFVLPPQLIVAAKQVLKTSLGSFRIVEKIWGHSYKHRDYLRKHGVQCY